MPANPQNVKKRVVISDGYQNEQAYIEFYTNSCMAIARGKDGEDLDRVWLDNLEKQTLHEELNEHLGDIESVTVELNK